MKIAYIIPSLRNVGPIIVVKNLVGYLVAQGELVEVYYFDDIKELEFDCKTILISKKDHIDFDFYDIIHSHCFRPDRFVYRWRKYINKAITVTTIHQDIFLGLASKYNKLFSHVITPIWIHYQNNIDYVTSISKSIELLYKDKINSEIVTIYNGCEITRNMQLDSLIVNKLVAIHNKGMKVIGTYAYLSKLKGLSQVIDVLPEMEDSFFVVIGSGPELVHLQNKAKRMHVDDRTLFIPYLPHPYKYLSFFDVYVMPSYSEGFGLALVEAALCKKSIVCSNINSFKELFNKDEVTFFELNDKESLVKSLETAYSSRTVKGQNSFLRATEHFTVDSMGQNYFNFYSKILRNKYSNIK